MAEAVHETVVIEADRQAVWDVLMDPRKLDDWVSAHRKLGDELPELPLSEGDTFRQKLGLGPASFWVDWEVLETREPEFAHWRGSGPGSSSADVTYRLSPEGSNGDATCFQYENDFDPPGGVMGRAAKKVVNATAGQREARKSLKRLRELF